MKHKKLNAYLKSLFISLTVIFCICSFVIGTSKAYKEINRISQAQYKSAFEINENGIRIFDFEIKLPI